MEALPSHTSRPLSPLPLFLVFTLVQSFHVVNPFFSYSTDGITCTDAQSMMTFNCHPERVTREGTYVAVKDAVYPMMT